MYHYTYLIQHKTDHKRYIGVRSSTVPPIEDTSYWGSSKHLPIDVKTTHQKIIIKEHPSRLEAVQHEILLHDLNNVAIDPSFYNKAKQTSTGFDTSGIPISEEMKAHLSTVLKGRDFGENHRKSISIALKGKPKTDEHKKACSVAQKVLAQQPGYKNPRQNANVSALTRSKISAAIKASGTSASVSNNRFKPWFITENNVTHLFYNQTKEEVSTARGYSYNYLQDLSTKSKGLYPIKRGTLKGIIIGNIEDAIKNLNKPVVKVQKRAWFITYDNYSIPFYYTTRKEYAEENGITAQSVADAIHISKGTKPLKRGPFKNCILGTIT